MKYFLRSLLIGLLCLAPLSTDATQRVAALISPQAINVDVGFVQVGNAGNLSVMGAPSGATFSLVTNPGGHFSIVGTEIIADPATPAGQYSITVHAAGTGYSVNKTFVLNYAGSSPVGQFMVGMNYSGLEDNNGVPNAGDMTYFSAKGSQVGRLPINWTSLQPLRLGTLNSAYTAQISQALANAAAAGIKLKVDLHNFGFGPDGIKLTPSDTAVFADVWLKLCAFLSSDPNAAAVQGIDTMNEWNSMDPNSALPSTTYSQSLILTLQSAVLTAVRGAGFNYKIYFEWDHYTGAWDSVANNVSQLMDLINTDPIHNSLLSLHSYFDNDSSGTNYCWAQEIAKPGLAPPGTPTNVNIFQERMQAVTTLAASKGVRVHVGETGISNDALFNGCADDYADWNTALFNALTFAQNNKIEFDYFASGGFTPGYGYYPGPSSVSNPSASDFTTAGLQSTQMVILEKFTGFSGAQPLAYRADAPFGVFPYSPVGTPLSGFKIRYNGHIPSTITFTGHAKLGDGTDVGGTFSSITLPPGDNGIATFSYTPAGSPHGGIQLTFTNNAGLTNPPALGFSSAASLFSGSVTAFSVHQIDPTYVGSIIELQKPSDGSLQQFALNSNGDLPRQSIQDFAGGVRQMVVSKWFSPDGSVADFLGNPAGGGGGVTPPYAYPYLLLVDLNNNGFPTVFFPGGSNQARPLVFPPQQMTGQGLLSIIARTFPFNGNQFASANWYATPLIQFGALSGLVTQTNFFPSYSVQWDCNPTCSSGWRLDSMTWSNLYGTNNLKGYLNGSVNAQASTPSFVFQPNDNQRAFNFGGFRDFGPTSYQGGISDFVFTYAELSSATQTSINSALVSYYAGTLPDSLTAVNPQIYVTAIPPPATSSITSPQNVTTSGFIFPFSAISVQDLNYPSPTDSATITLSGDSNATLSGSGLSGSYPTYTVASTTAASLGATLQALHYQSSSSVGTVGTIALQVNSSFSTHANASVASTVVPNLAPVLTVGTSFQTTTYVEGHSARPMNYVNRNNLSQLFSDSNPGSPTDSISITLSGDSGATLTAAQGLSMSGSGLGPYTIAADTPTNTAINLRHVQYQSSNTGSSTSGVMSITATSSVGTSTTVNVPMTRLAAVVETSYAAPPSGFTPLAARYKGYNFSGPELVPYPGGQGNYGGFFPHHEEIDYFAGKGMGSMRLIFLVQHLFPAAYQQADPPYRTDEGFPSQSVDGSYPHSVSTPHQYTIDLISDVIDYAASKGVSVILDMHNFGSIFDTRYDGGGGILDFLPILSGPFSLPDVNQLWGDEWGRLAKLYKNKPNVMFGLMNEPANTTAQQFHDAALVALASIRAAGATQKVIIAGGGNFDDAEPWASVQGTIWDTFNQPGWTGTNGDPANNFAFEGHKYFNYACNGDPNGNDGTTSCYRNSDGTPVAASTLLGGMTTWMRQTNGGTPRAVPFQALLTEMGWRCADPKCGGYTGANPETVSNSMLDLMSANSDVWLGWNFFLGGTWYFWGAGQGDGGVFTGYPWGNIAPLYGTFPPGYTTMDAPQMTQLQAHMP